MNIRDKLQRKACTSKNDFDWATYKRLRNQCNNKIKQGKCIYYMNLINENHKNPAKFWKCIKEIFPTKDRAGNSPTSSHNATKNTATANIL